jgi:hypothetical protein
MSAENSRPVASEAAEENAPGRALSAAIVTEVTPFDSRSLSTERTNNRIKLRQLITQIELDQQAKVRDIQQDILHASSWWWRWRAEQFHQARPRAGEYHGQATPEELTQAWYRCDEIARACLAKADLLDMLAAEGADLDDETLPLHVVEATLIEEVA